MDENMKSSRDDELDIKESDGAVINVGVYTEDDSLNNQQKVKKQNADKAKADAEAKAKEKKISEIASRVGIIMLMCSIAIIVAMLIWLMPKNNDGTYIPEDDDTSNVGDAPTNGSNNQNTSTSKGSAGLTFKSNGDGTCVLSGSSNCKDTKVTIPEVSPDGDVVVGINAMAFYLNVKAREIVIPSTVTYIQSHAFFKCTVLSSVVIPGSVTVVEENAFVDCNLLKFETHDGIKYLGNNNNPYHVILGGYDQSKSMLVMDDFAIVMADRAFVGFTNIKQVIIPKGIKKIASAAFKDCTSLEYVYIPKNIISIGSFAFMNCTSLESITIPDSVTEIDLYAFNGASSLTSIVIGKNVSSIGQSAFGKCTSLTDVYFAGSEADWQKIAISQGNDLLKKATIHYNYGTN